jgi:hypothetical protein
MKVAGCLAPTTAVVAGVVVVPTRYAVDPTMFSILYPVIALPPLPVGADHDRENPVLYPPPDEPLLAKKFVGVTVRLDGAVGGWGLGVTGIVTLDHAPMPVAFRAATRITYVTPFESPVTVLEYGSPVPAPNDVACVHLAPLLALYSTT